jgi:hypothetical protein
MLNTKYTDLANVACDIFSIMPYGVGDEVSFYLFQDVIGWSKSITTGQTLGKNMVVWQLARSNAGLLVGNIPITHSLDVDNNAEIKKEAEKKKLHRMAKILDYLEMWQGSDNLRSTQMAACTQILHMTAMRYISDMDEIMKSVKSKSEGENECAELPPDTREGKTVD